MIKNAITYNVKLPEIIEMMEFISSGEGIYLSRKPDIGQISTIGFSNHPVTKAIASEFEGGYCLTVTKWEKKLDSGAINACLSDNILDFEDNNGRSVTKKEKQEMKEDLIARLLPSVLPTPKTISAYYIDKTNVLIIDTVSDKEANEFTSLLRKVIGSLSATTLYIDNTIGLTETLAVCLDEDERMIVDGILVESSLELKGDGRVQFKDVDLFDETTSEEIIGQIREGGMYVKNISLYHNNDETNFDLTDGFKFKNFKFNQFPESEDDDVQFAWQAETFYAVTVINKIVDVITTHFTIVQDD